MGKVAFVFPGQGSQQVGMGRDVIAQYEQARQIYEQANQTLDYDLSGLILDGPEEQLKLTYHTQPALLTTSIAILEVFKQKGIIPDYVAGHSLGEYSALVAADVISFEAAVSTVQARGQFMDEAVPSGEGAMAAVLGADREALSELCRQVSQEAGLVELANLNCPGQIVVSGSAEGVQAIVERGQQAGAKRVIALEVSGPFHSSLMKPAAEKFKGVLDQLVMKEASMPIVANVTARPVTEPSDIRRLLTEQVYSPVLWEDSIAWMLEQGVDTFYEIGSGKVLTGLIKKINRSVRAIPIHSCESLKEELDV